MKFILFPFLLVLCWSSTVAAQQVSELLATPAGTNNYSTANFDVCGNPVNYDFQVYYQYCPTQGSGNNSCLSGCTALNSNKFRYTVTFYRDGVVLGAYNEFKLSSDWFRASFLNVLATPGNYQATIFMERRNNTCTGWVTVANSITNVITVGTTPNNSEFDINGVAVPTNGSAINFCPNYLRMNGAASTCETDYYIAVEESDQYFNRTFEYEWGGWFSGEAPNNIDIQNLAQTFGVGANYTGTDATREGEALKGGNLSGGGLRYYRVKLCTAPNWHCKTALVRANSTICRLDPSAIVADNNVYLPLDNASTPPPANSATLGGVEGERAAVTAFQDVSTISILPNPAQTSTLVQVEDYEGQAPIVFELYNNLGQRVLVKQSSQASFQIERGNLPAGVYVYRATSGETALGSGKLIFQ